MAEGNGYTNHDVVALRRCDGHRIRFLPRPRAVASSSRHRVANRFIAGHFILGCYRCPEAPPSLCYDYDSFVYFAWPIVAPIYLFQTRGVRAFLTLLCFAGISLAATSIALAISLLRGIL